MPREASIVSAIYNAELIDDSPYEATLGVDHSSIKWAL